MARDLGRLGELKLEEWAAQNDIALTRVGQDKNGWDYLVEFSLTVYKSNGPPRPFHDLPCPLKCLVQVKSTSRRKRSWPIKLSNWLKLARHPGPAFFLILEFDSEPQPQRAFLIHLDKHWISVAQKGYCELIAVGKETSSHKKTLSVRYNETHSLPDLNSLEHGIRQHVGDPLKYTDQKLQLLNQVGYESGGGKITLTLCDDGPFGVELINYLADLSIGLNNPLPVERIEVFDGRFGYCSPTPSHVMDKAVLTIPATPLGKAETYLKTKDHFLKLSMDLFVPKGFGSVLPSEDLRIRATNNLLDLLIYPLKASKSNFTLHVPQPCEAVSLVELAQFGRLIAMLKGAHEQTSAIQIEISYETSVCFQNEITVQNNLPPTLEAFSDPILSAWMATKQLDIENDVNSCLEEIWAQKETLAVLKSFLRPERTSIRFGDQSGDAFPDLEGDKICIPFPIQIKLGDYQLVFGFEVHGIARVAQKNEGTCVPIYAIEKEEKRLVRTSHGRSRENLRHH